MDLVPPHQSYKERKSKDLVKSIKDKDTHMKREKERERDCVRESKGKECVFG